MSKSVIAVLVAIVLITVASFGGYTYVQGFVYHEYNARNYEVQTVVNGDETTLTITLDKNEAYSNVGYTRNTVLPDDFGDELYGNIRIRPEPTMNDDGTPVLDENGNLQYADWGRLGDNSGDGDEMTFSKAMEYVRSGQSINPVKSEYTYRTEGDKVILTVTVKGYEFKDGDNIHIEVSNDITMAGIKVKDNFLALTNAEFKDGEFSEVENMFVNTEIKG